MFGKKKIKQISFDKEKLCPVIRSSICTGEKTAGFRHIGEKGFDEVMLIRDEKDLDIFLKTYGLKKEEVKIEY